MGFFSQELFACAAQVRIGPCRESFWAVYERAPAGAGEGGLAGGEAAVRARAPAWEPALARERTRLLPRRGEVDVSPGVLALSDRGVELVLELAEEDGWEARCGPVWTRKQAGIAARGALRVDGGREHALRGRAVIDDTDGHHPRVTEWRWCAGVGSSPAGEPLAWNLVSGINDPPSGSERAVWIGGVPHEAPPVRFAEDLCSLSAADGSRLQLSPEFERSRRDRLVVVSSDYRARFGSFSGTLPGGVALAEGLGLVEHHRARW